MAVVAQVRNLNDNDGVVESLRRSAASRVVPAGTPVGSAPRVEPSGTAWEAQ